MSFGEFMMFVKAEQVKKEKQKEKENARKKNQKSIKKAAGK
ncbi:hypothetical protein [Bacillus xiapuensis]|uniref:Uncharacterized protein n=1 Tax=Bacillus xiapuensis TaxID=2014075 RepID=A0ABU6N5J4_9BACI|nr:hypothetical protein [Bacillus xiapuensis]